MSAGVFMAILPGRYFYSAGKKEKKENRENVLASTANVDKCKYGTTAKQQQQQQEKKGDFPLLPYNNNNNPRWSSLST